VAQDQKTFWRAICKSPDDDTVRLVYADWLEEHGYTPRAGARVDRSDPLALGRARAEFIRVQCALARLPIGDPRHTDLEVREHLLLREHRETWLEELPEWLRRSISVVNPVAFGRGFVSTMRHGAYQYAVHARGLATGSVIDEVEFRDLSSADVPRVAACAHLPRLRRLQMEPHTVAEHLPILTSPRLTGLRALRLDDPTLGDSNPVKSFGKLLAAHAFRTLEALELPLSRRYEEPILGGLIRHLGAAPLDRLTRLNLVSRPVAAKHWQALLDAAYAPRLTELLMNVDPDPAVLEVLVGTERLSALRRLLLAVPRRDHGPTAPADGARVLATAKHLPNLVDLRLHHCNDAALKHLAGAPILEQLTELHIAYSTYSNGGITVRGWRALAGSPWLRNLTRLQLYQNDLTDDGLCALAASPHLGKLAELNVSSEPITEDGLSALADSPHLPALRVVWAGLDSAGWGDDAERIRKRFAGRFQVI
jgi:uncharacterized protein (TIGR02996 family)